MTAEVSPSDIPFSSHLKEMRQRVLVSALAVVLCSSVAYFFSEQLVQMFMVPLHRALPDLGGLVYTKLTEALFSYIKLSILVGVIVSFPVISFQAWRFALPGLQEKEKRLISRIVLFSTVLFVGGVVFCFLVVLPVALEFMLGLVGEGVRPLPKVGTYLTFVARTCLAFGLAFEIPFLMVAVGKVGLVDRSYFVTKRKYFALAILVLSFLLVAGDPFAAVLLTLPLLALYEAGILVMRIFGSSSTDDS